MNTRRLLTSSALLGALAVSIAAAMPSASELQKQAAGIFKPLPKEMTSPDNPLTPEKIALGRMLYYDTRFSVSQTISCNTCHQLAKAGVDNEPTSEGHAGKRGDRNSPTTYNAALHIAQFWDGRAPTVEEQAKGPVLNPVEMGMPNADYVIEVLKSIPGYVPLFAAAFPGEADPISYDNFAKAIGAFERKLVTPSPFDEFLEGNTKALDAKQLAGLDTFLSVGCITCHNSVGVGGGLYQKIGLVHEYKTEDVGRAKLTNNEADKFFFKVPSLRNVVLTGPYFHQGQVATVQEAVKLMGWHQLGRELTPDQVTSIVTFLGSLTGKPDAAYIAKPALPPSGPKTPKPPSAKAG